MSEVAQTEALQLWGGLECTVNRVGDEYRDQLELTGHYPRVESDLRALAGLGIRVVRYPLLWERCMRSADVARIDWSECDARLEALRRAGLEPIVGLVHHGSGPAFTDLSQESFAPGLAEFARAVARRYPWIERYTPVNEPLTTARFSGLYGHWYPHARSDETFVRMLLNQCRATLLAMAEIRAVNPRALLVQTEDVGRIYSTARLGYQAAFENERRWLSWDLLTGRVGRRHPLHRYLLEHGATSSELDWFEHQQVAPILLGINHYVTSDRFLHHRVDLFDPARCGGNGRHRYADVEAVRVRSSVTPSMRTAIHDCWSRYRLPLAITEAHLGCTREEQARWIYQAWCEASRARERGIPVQAVTAWSLFGSCDWNSLLTRAAGHYECGAFDVRAPTPRATVVAGVLQRLADGSAAQAFPWITSPGWWQRPERHFPALGVPLVRRALAQARPAPRCRPLLITGGSGTLGQALRRACEVRGLPYHLTRRAELDIADADAVQRTLELVQPWAVINGAGFVRVDAAEAEPDVCERENVLGPELLAQACAMRDIPLLTFSSDLVFDGGSAAPYVESDPTAPLNVYGRSKAAAEARVGAALERALIIRTSSFFGPWDQANFVYHLLQTLQRGEVFRAAADVRMSPTYVPDLVNASLDLLLDGERGVWHLANRGCVSWSEFALEAARCTGATMRGRLEACSAEEMGWTARRPAFSALGSERGHCMPTLEDALGRYAESRKHC